MLPPEIWRMILKHKRKQHFMALVRYHQERFKQRPMMTSFLPEIFEHTFAFYINGVYKQMVFMYEEETEHYPQERSFEYLVSRKNDYHDMFQLFVNY